MALDLQELGLKLRHLREVVLQQTLEDIAERSNIAIAQLEEMENGQMEPTGDQILILSDVYKQDLEYFITNQRITSFEKAKELFRKFDKELSPDDRMKIQEFLYLCRSETDFEKMMGGRMRVIEFIPDIRGKYFKQHAWLTAQKLREELGYDDMPLDDVFGIVRRLGCHIFRRKLGRSAISGVFIRHDDIGNCILINYDEDIYRQNFSALHELAHAIFDLDYEVNLSMQNVPGQQENLREVRANNFASRMLIPARIAENAGVGKTTTEIADTTEKLCRQYQTNFETALIALKDASRISDQQFNELRGSRAIHKSEKEDPALAGHAPKVRERRFQFIERGLSPEYVNVCFEAFHRGAISRGRLADALLVSHSELPEIASIFGQRLEVSE